jgi:hypothetical protein
MPLEEGVADSPSRIDLLKLFAHLHWMELTKAGDLSRARTVRLAQAVLGDAVQVAITFALVAGMKSQDTATLLSLYSSTLSLSNTLGTELWQVLHCARQTWESSSESSKAAVVEVHSTNPVAETGDMAPASAALSATMTMPKVPGPAPKRAESCGPCACVVRCIVQGPCSCCCRSQACRGIATSPLSRLLCVGLVAFILVFSIVFNQLRQYASGIASVRMDVYLSINGTVTLPGGRVVQVAMNRTLIRTDVPAYRAQHLVVTERIPIRNAPDSDAVVLRTLAHNEEFLTISAGFEFEALKGQYGPSGLGCALLWQGPDPRDPEQRPEIPIGQFATECATTVGVSGGTNLPRGACVFPISAHAAQAPYDPRPNVRTSIQSDLYKKLFGEQCEQMTRHLSVSGAVEMVFLGACDLSSVL